MMRKTWRIAAKDLRLRVRDKTIFIVGVIAPLVLAFIFNAIFGAAFSDVGSQITFDVGVASEDQGALNLAFRAMLAEIEKEGLFEVREYAAEAAGAQAVEDGDVGAVFVIPEDFTVDVFENRGAGLSILGDVDAPSLVGITSSIARRFALTIDSARLASGLAVAAGAIPEEEYSAAVQEAGLNPPGLTLGEIEAGTRQLDSSTYFVAGLSVYFVLFIAGLAITSMLDEREDGTMLRLLAAPIGKSSIIAGKALAALVMCLMSLAVLVVASSYLMGADWGNWLGVSLLVIAVSVTSVAVMSMVGGLARTAEQANALQGVIATVMAMLGGTFVPIPADGLLQKVSLLTPNAWFMRGLGEMSGGGLADAIPAIGALVLMGAVCTVVSLTLVRKVVHL